MMVIIMVNGLDNLDRAVCISHSTTSFRKRMNATSLFPAMDKL